MKTLHADITILGGGIAGLSLALEAHKNGLKCVLIEREEIGAGASGALLALANPATGRKATPTWRALESLALLKQNLQTVSPHSSCPFWAENGIFRPAKHPTMAEDFKETPDQLRSSNIQWVQKDALPLFSSLNMIDGGLLIPNGLTVAMKEYLLAITNYLRDKGHMIVEQATLNEQASKAWIKTRSGAMYRLVTNFVIHCTGSSIVLHPMWRYVPLHLVKGQLMQLKLHDDLPFSCSISGLGYLAQLPSHQPVMGSTYEHHFIDGQCDESGRLALYEKFEDTFVHAPSFELLKQWSGIRVSTPGRLPILGLHPKDKKHGIMAGFGSKGLLYSALCSQLMLEHLVQHKPLPQELDLARFQRYFKV